MTNLRLLVWSDQRFSQFQHAHCAGTHHVAQKKVDIACRFVPKPRGGPAVVCLKHAITKALENTPDKIAHRSLILHHEESESGRDPLLTAAIVVARRQPKTRPFAVARNGYIRRADRSKLPVRGKVTVISKQAAASVILDDSRGTHQKKTKASIATALATNPYTRVGPA